MRYLICILLIIASPTFGDVARVVEDHIKPAVAAFTSAAQSLEATAEADCRAEAVKPAYHATFDAWMGMSHLNFGPLETEGRALTISFWPDTRGLIPRTTARMISEQDKAVNDPLAFAEVSIATRGLFALEQVLFEQNYQPQDYTCALVQAISRDLALTAQEVALDWEVYAKALTSAGVPGNVTYLSVREAHQDLYTALLTGIEFTRDQRLGRPLGTFDRPRPKRAEARRSERSLRNVALSIAALEALARAFVDWPTPEMDQAFADAHRAFDAYQDPAFTNLNTPTDRLRLEILQQRVNAIGEAFDLEIAQTLGLTAGFNSLDGD